jgi:hypothetical protein
MSDFEFSLQGLKGLRIRCKGDFDPSFLFAQALLQAIGPLISGAPRMIDVTPSERQLSAAPSAPPTTLPSARRKSQRADNSYASEPVSTERSNFEGHTDQGNPSPSRSRRSRRESFREQVFAMLQENYFHVACTAKDIRKELIRRGHHFNPKSIASDLLWLTKKNYLSRDRNEDRVYAYVKGPNNDFPGS